MDMALSVLTLVPPPLSTGVAGAYPHTPSVRGVGAELLGKHSTHWAQLQITKVSPVDSLFSILFCFFSGRGEGLHMLSKHSTTKLHSQLMTV